MYAACHRPLLECQGQPIRASLTGDTVSSTEQRQPDKCAGPQRSARRATSARAVIGSETRAGRNNRFMDEELEKTICGRDTPAPVAYEVQERLGKTPLSTKRSSPQARMGTARRFGEGGGAQRGGAEMAYDAAVSALGRQLQSRKKSLPSYGFGTSTRDGVRGVRQHVQHQRQLCDVCKVFVQSSIAIDAMAIMKLQWRWRTTLAHAGHLPNGRLHYLFNVVQVYISKEHGKVLHGVGTPGPATAQGVSAFQGQKMSYKATQPAYRFGSARRLPRHLADTLPGPQTYCA